jgi:hypothetical protein
MPGICLFLEKKGNKSRSWECSQERLIPERKSIRVRIESPLFYGNNNLAASTKAGSQSISPVTGSVTYSSAIAQVW